MIGDTVDEVVVAGLAELHAGGPVGIVVGHDGVALVAVPEIRPRHFQDAMGLGHIVEHYFIYTPPHTFRVS